MSDQYTKATLIASLQSFVDSHNAELVASMPELIMKGEARLAKRLDLDALDSAQPATTAANSDEVNKPDNLIVDRYIELNTGDEKTMVHHRSRMWVSQYNSDGEIGVPKYYCELDQERWRVAPLAAQAYVLQVHGLYRPTSIVDGGDDGTTWFSTRVPELLHLACMIEVSEFLKFWSKKSAQEADFEEQAGKWLKTAGALQRSDVEDLVGNRMNSNKPDTQAE